MSKPNVPRRWEKASEAQRQKMADELTEQGLSRLPEGHIALSYRNRQVQTTSNRKTTSSSDTKDLLSRLLPKVDDVFRTEASSKEQDALWFFKNNILHREDGPAYESVEGRSKYYLDGKLLTKKEWVKSTGREINVRTFVNGFENELSLSEPDEIDYAKIDDDFDVIEKLDDLQHTITNFSRFYLNYDIADREVKCKLNQFKLSGFCHWNAAGLAIYLNAVNKTDRFKIMTNSLHSVVLDTKTNTIIDNQLDNHNHIENTIEYLNAEPVKVITVEEHLESIE